MILTLSVTTTICSVILVWLYRRQVNHQQKVNEKLFDELEKERSLSDMIEKKYGSKFSNLESAIVEIKLQVFGAS